MLTIRRDDLSGPEIRALLEEHLRSMYEITPPESVHAFDLGKLRQPDVTFWSVWSGPELVGCGALRELDPRHGEIKSMRTVATRLRSGVGRAVLNHIIEEARRRSYRRLSLETGSMAEFEPARRLYESFGFAVCAPFGDYREDPNSVFMTLALRSRRAGFLAVARTIFFGLLMIGKKQTWETDGIGARMTPGQIVVGALVGGIVLVGLLILIVRIAIGLVAS